MNATIIVFALLVLSGGCVGLVDGDGLAFESTPADVSDATLVDAGYDRLDTRAVSINRTVPVEGSNTSVELTNWVSSYEKSVQIPGASATPASGAMFLITTPAVTVAGTSLNPVAEFSNEALVRFVFEYANSQLAAGSAGEVTTVSERPVSLLNQSVALNKFRTSVQMGGQGVDVTIQMAKVEHEGDIVIFVTLYPQALDASEDDVTAGIVNGVTH
jgi:hypothetical protein